MPIRKQVFANRLVDVHFQQASCGFAMLFGELVKVLHFSSIVPGEVFRSYKKI